jgi:tetratricopeptide (TPR) repeat protein
MASNPKTNEPQGIDPVEALDLQQGLGKVEAFWEQNKQILTYAGGGLLALVLGAYYIWGVYLPTQQKEAVNLMYVAERYFENDSLNLAVKGDGNFPGFEEIAEDYRWTPAGNLARYYLGVSYLRLGQSKEALEALESFKTSDPVMGSIALGCQGDAHLQLKNDREALEYYLKASEFKANEFTTPFYLQRAGEIAEKTGQKEKALECYERIQREYPQSTEGQNVDRYLTRVRLKS